jgi:hypothetical protein
MAGHRQDPPARYFAPHRGACLKFRSRVSTLWFMGLISNFVGPPTGPSPAHNPFRRPDVRSVGGERGLGRIEPVRGVLTLYSAGIGQTALDRLGDADTNPNSVFTRVLVPALGRPGVHLGDLAVEIREEVARLAETVGHDQRPAYYDETIGGRIYLAGAS